MLGVAQQKIKKMQEISLLLMSKKMRRTPERFATINEIFNYKEPFRAIQIQEKLLISNYRISPGTVYNTLDFLEKTGFVKSYYLSGHKYFEVNHFGLDLQIK
jgi:Fur family ferric uptake transcriptional regulator